MAEVPSHNAVRVVRVKGDNSRFFADLESLRDPLEEFGGGAVRVREAFKQFLYFEYVTAADALMVTVFPRLDGAKIKQILGVA